MTLRIVNRRKRAVAQALDRLGFALFRAFPGMSTRQRTPREIKRILAVRLAYIGDVVLTVPAIKALKSAFPEATISFLTGSSARNVVEMNPYIHEVITYDAPWFYPRKRWSILTDYIRFVRLLRSQRFDMVIDFRGDLRDILLVLFASGAPRRVGKAIAGGGFALTDIVPDGGEKHKVEFHLDICRALAAEPVAADTMNLYPTEQDRHKVRDLLQKEAKTRQRRLIGLHPGGRVKLKSWDVGSFARLGDVLAETHQATIAVTGGPQEASLAEELLGQMKHGGINLCGKISLRQLQVLLGKMDLFVTNDTASLHIASGANTPTVAIFGPSEVWDTGPLSDNRQVVMRHLACRTSCDTYTCHSRAYHECLRAITPEEVLQACNAVMGNGG